MRPRRRQARRRSADGWIASIWLGLLITGGVALAWLAFNKDVSLVGTDLPAWGCIHDRRGDRLLRRVYRFVHRYGLRHGADAGAADPRLFAFAGGALPAAVRDPVGDLRGGCFITTLAMSISNGGRRPTGPCWCWFCFRSSEPSPRCCLQSTCPKFYVKLYIAAMIIGISLFLLIGSRFSITFLAWQDHLAGHHRSLQQGHLGRRLTAR